MILSLKISTTFQKKDSEQVHIANQRRYDDGRVTKTAGTTFRCVRNGGKDGFCTGAAKIESAQICELVPHSLRRELVLNSFFC